LGGRKRISSGYFGGGERTPPYSSSEGEKKKGVSRTSARRTEEEWDPMFHKGEGGKGRMLAKLRAARAGRGELSSVTYTGGGERKIDAARM